MKRRLAVVLVWVVTAVFLLGGCAAQKSMMKDSDFRPVDLNGKLSSGEYMQKVKSFLVVLDASGTMVHQSYEGKRKLCIAKDLVSRMNMTIPDMPLVGGLRTFGSSFSDSSTQLVYGMGPYSKAALGQVVMAVAGGGYTPLGHAMNAAGEDLAAAVGHTAMIIVSDGLETDTGSVAAAKNLKSQFGSRLCIYTVLVGDDPEGGSLLEQLAQVGECGFSVSAESIMSAADMAGFVEKVFLAHMADSDLDGVPDSMDQCPGTPRGVKVDEKGCPLDHDGDGVPDYLDQCPNTPRGVKVDSVGCPLDTDGDGVYDYRDQCPNTPKGARVNEVGCWVLKDEDLKNVEFDFDKWNIKPQYYSSLDHVVMILKENPGLRVEVQGHTDSIGSDAYNQGLSEKRAMAVMKYLTGKGIAEDRLTAVGYGESKPITSNETDEGRARNRRVQLKPLY
jgi:OOP family OmpA-OmpF porin